MKIDGSCLCGYLTYEAEIDPEKVKACHCTECQTQSGAAFRTVAPGHDFRFLSGAPKIYVKTADSGAKRALAFCPECGSPIYGTDAEGVSGRYSIRVGTVRQRDRLAPREQIWFRSAQGWVADMGSVPKRDKQ